MSDPFRARIDAVPRYRRVFDPVRDRGSFIVTGRPSEWARASGVLRAAGSRVVAYHDRLIETRRPVFARRPVLFGRIPLGLGACWLIAGLPRKVFFDAAPDAINRGLWHEPLTGYRQSARHDAGLLARRGDELREVMSRLHDEHSRDTYASMIRARLEGDAGYFALAPYREYGHPVVHAVPGDVVIDGGAFTGDSARRFAWSTFGFGKIVSLEPDKQNFERLARRRIPGLLPLNLGAWNERTTLRFADGAAASSRISQEGGAQIDVATIDEIVEQQRLVRVDLIKLDVEGAEREALEGARESLRRFRPKLQISIYHKRDDLFELPLGLMRQLPDYRWYVGHHGPWVTESDLYGMPCERATRMGALRSRSG